MKILATALLASTLGLFATGCERRVADLTLDSEPAAVPRRSHDDRLRQLDQQIDTVRDVLHGAGERAREDLAPELARIQADRDRVAEVSATANPSNVDRVLADLEADLEAMLRSLHQEAGT